MPLCYCLARRACAALLKHYVLDIIGVWELNVFFIIIAPTSPFYNPQDTVLTPISERKSTEICQI